MFSWALHIFLFLRTIKNIKNYSLEVNFTSYLCLKAVAQLCIFLLPFNDFLGCYNNIWTIVKLLCILGFTVNAPDKLLIPTQENTYFGFILNSIKWDSKKEKKLYNMFYWNTDTIYKLAMIFGNLVAAFLAWLVVNLQEFGKIEIDALKQCYGNFDASFSINDEGLT